MYGDFETATFYQTVAFLYGVATTFIGVFVIAWAPNDGAENDEESLTDAGASRIASPESIGRRRGTLTSNGARDAPGLRRTQSTINIIGLSPAKVCLLLMPNPTAYPRFDDSIFFSSTHIHRNDETTLRRNLAMTYHANVTYMPLMHGTAVSAKVIRCLGQEPAA